MDVGADLKRNVLPNGLDPVGDELVDDVPWVVGPLGYTVCMCVCVCVCVCVHTHGCLVRSFKICASSSSMGAHFTFPFIEMYRRVHHHFCTC